MADEKEIVMVTVNYVPGKKITQVIGPIWGITVRSRGLGQNIAAYFRSWAGGEIGLYTKMLSDARKTAMDRLRESAKELGANAVIEIRFDTSEISKVMNEVVAYGTAVIAETISNPAEMVSLS
ncbi:MAG: heavy metal-binding domain-containing protein [Thermoplasmata archaeon]